MSYKKEVITAEGYSRLQAIAKGKSPMHYDIEAKKTIRGEDPRVIIPFHSVERVISVRVLEDRPDRNPYGCKPEILEGGKVCTARVCKDKVGC